MPLSSQLKTVLTAATLVLMGLGATSAMAQAVYRIIGPDGKVTFSDRPAPAAAQAKSSVDTRAEAAAKGGNTGSALPYALQQIARQFPVTLYTSSNCAPCNSARNLLTNRGVPFTERTVNTADDADALQSISKDNSLPFGTIGGQQLKGFSDVEWMQYLDAAGYPQTSQLPANYRRPAATPLVVAKTPEQAAPGAPAAAQQVAPPQDPEPRNAPSTSNPSGIQF